MLSVCLPSDALSQHLPSYLGFSYLGHGVSPQGHSSKVQPLLLILDEGYLFTAVLSDLECGIAPLGPPCLRSHCSLDMGLVLPATTPGSRQRVTPPGRCPLSQAEGSSSRLLLCCHSLALSATAPVLGCGVVPLSHSCAITAWHSHPLPLTSELG